jgi:peptide/nickel transport system ATP-binding protein
MDNILRIEDLSVEYLSGHRKVRALDGVSLVVPMGKIVVVVGESGCGKSTLGLAIIGLLPGSSKVVGGSVFYKGTDLIPMSEKQRRTFRGTEIAMVFQEPLTSLNPVYRVEDQLAEAIQVREHRKNGGNSQRLGKDEVRNEAVELLRRTRTPDPEQVSMRYPFELSGGMRQRVMIAMVLAEKPSLLIADEPTTALDVTTQAQVLRLIKALMTEASASVLLITHDLAVAAQVADEVVLLYAGSVVEVANVIDLFAHPLHPYTSALLTCIPVGSKDETRLKAIPGRPPALKERIIGCKFANRCVHVMEICGKQTPQLLEVEPNHKVACFLYDK